MYCRISSIVLKKLNNSILFEAPEQNTRYFFILIHLFVKFGDLFYLPIFVVLMAVSPMIVFNVVLEFFLDTVVIVHLVYGSGFPLRRVLMPGQGVLRVPW